MCKNCTSEALNEHSVLFFKCLTWARFLFFNTNYFSTLSVRVHLMRIFTLCLRRTNWHYYSDWNQRKCRWSASGLPRYGGCSQPVWWRVFSRPAWSGPAAGRNSDGGGGRDPTRENIHLHASSPLMLSHLPQHITQTHSAQVFLKGAVCIAVLFPEVLMHYQVYRKTHSAS